MQGGVLVNMVGRPPKCLRCLQRGHIKFHCTAPYCHKCREVGYEQSDDCRPTRSYASLVRRSEPADQDDMDDPAEINDVTMDDQQTTSQSWAHQMDQLDQAAAETQVEHPAPADDAAAPSETPVEPAVVDGDGGAGAGGGRVGGGSGGSRVGLRRTTPRRRATQKTATADGGRSRVASASSPLRRRDTPGR